MRSIALIATLLCIGFTVLAQQPNNKVESYKGNTITTAYIYDTIPVENPESGEITYKILRSQKAELLNGQPVYYENEATEAIGSASQKDLEGFLEGLAYDDFKNLAGKSKNAQVLIVINEKGKLAFFQPKHGTGQEMERKKMPKEFENVEKKLENINFVPAMKDGKAVPYGITISSFVRI